jgi:hypothetical protein
MTVAVRLDTLNATQSWGGSVGESQIAAEISNRIRKPLLDGEYRKIGELMLRPEVQPSSNAVKSASLFLQNSLDRAMKLGSWSSPHITLSEAGEIVFEWWQNDKKITLYFGDTEPEYIKVWGTNIHTEMESGILTYGWGLTVLWLWLHS